MRRYLLDTNILIFMLTGKNDDISLNVKRIFDVYPELYVSSVSIIELFQLFEKKKFKSKIYKTKLDLLNGIQNDFHMKIIDFGTNQLIVNSKVSPIGDHNDPFDYAIISHAICNKIPLISSDHKFSDYQKHGLELVFNKR